jgi:ketosteroid isomerase-like protein
VFVKIPLLSFPPLLVYVILAGAACYLGTRRSVTNTLRSNTPLVVVLKVSVLVSLTCIAVIALFASAAKPAYRGASPPLSFTYFAAAQPANDDAATLRKLEGEFMKAAAEEGSAGYMSYYADDAVEVPNGGPLIQGKVNIAKGMGFLDDKNNSLTWVPVGADISAAGDLGYTYGTFEFRSKDKDGKVVVDHGKYTSIWKKQKDHSWKVVLDMGNASSQPK